MSASRAQLSSMIQASSCEMSMQKPSFQRSSNHSANFPPAQGKITKNVLTSTSFVI